MATRKIATGTLVSVKADALQSRRRKPSEGGVGIVQGRKKRHTVPINGVEDDKEDTTSILTSTTTGTGTKVFGIRYTLDNRLSQDVAKERVSVALLDTTARRRSAGADSSRNQQPSLLSASRAAGAATFQLGLPTTRHARQQQQESHQQQQPKKYSHAWLLLAMKEKVKGGEWKHIAALRHKKARDSSGWLRRMESPSTCHVVSKKPPHLGDVEKKKAMDLYIACRPHDAAAALVAHAWGVTPHTIRGLFKKMCQSTTASNARKKRSDAGVSILTSDNKRRAVYTEKFVFAKLLRSEHPDAKFTKQQIDEAWDGATQAKRDTCAATAAEWVQQGPFLIAELAKALSSTRGSVSWRTVATLVSGSGNLEMISHTTVREFVMSLPDSSYTSTKLLPKLDRSNKQRRMWWAQQFWIFFQSAKTFSNVQIILVHMDEKWFWSIVVRRNLKNVPVLGIEPVQHSVQHKSHIDKTMGIASTAFIPRNNNMEAGGEAHLVSLTRVGRMEKAKKDTYKRVYRNDGTYHYPKNAGNRMRVKGQEYFRNMEITGSNNGTINEPKFDLLSWFEQVEIPALEQLCERAAASSGKQCVVRYQMDGAGPHQDRVLNDFLRDEFCKRRWHLKIQPSNSPVTNVKDDCLFPALSKHVSRAQGITKGSQIFSPDELWAAVQKCWNNFPVDALARGYVRHGQIASALIDCNGGDNFVRERGGLHHNVRNCCVTVCDEEGNPKGVEMTTCYNDDENNEGGSTQQQSLRYKMPDVGESIKQNLARMTPAEINLLFHELPVHHEWFEHVMEAFVALEDAQLSDSDE